MARAAKTAALEYQSIVAPDVRGFALWANRSEAAGVDLLEGSFRLLRSTAESELVGYDFAIVTIDHRRQVTPAVRAAGHVGHVHR